MSTVTPELHDLIAQRLRVRHARWRHGPSTTIAPGGHRGAPLGRGMEFAEVRPYQPGDDLRSMDWRHTARRGRPFTKLFHEERERPVMLFVDLGPTMHFGTRVAFKSVVAARAAALLAWAATDAGDRVGGIVWDGLSHRETGPRGYETGALALIRQIVRPATAERGPQGSLPSALQTLVRTARPGTQVVVISDFHDFDEAAGRELARLGRGTGLALVQVYDVLEASPPPVGIYRIGDGRNEMVLDLRTVSARAAYGAAFRARSEHLEALARRLGATLLPLATHDDPLLALDAPLGLRHSLLAPAAR